jgi:hypothetical protein
MIEVVVDAQSLKRSGRGSITGRILLRGPVGSFPEEQWSDFPVVILTWWIEGLNNIVAGGGRTFEGMFMDGPFSFIVHRGEGKSGRIAWGKRGQEAAVGILDIGALLGSAVAAGKVVAAFCRAQGWNSSDLEKLEEALARVAP